MRKEKNQRRKNTTKKILPFVMSTSMLTAAFFAAESSVLADEKGNEPAFKNHGAEVSYFAKTIPGSPEKGKIMRTIASKNWQDKTSNEPIEEEEAVDEPTDKDDNAEEPIDEDQEVDEPADEEDNAEEPTDGDQKVDGPADENDSNNSEEKERPTDDNIDEDTTSADQSTDSNIITEEQENVYKSIIENLDSLIDYYNILIKDHLGIILPGEEATDETAKGEDGAKEPAEKESADEPAEGEDQPVEPAKEESADEPAEGEDQPEEHAEEESADEPAEGEDQPEEPAEEESTDEPAEETTIQPTIWDKLVGYCQQVVTAYESFFNLIK